MSTRLSIAEQIDHLEFEDDEVVFKLIQEINQEDLDACGFRWSSSSTQKQQDRLLANYQAFVKVTSRPRITVDSDEETVNDRCFPPDPPKFEQMFKSFRVFLIFLADRTPARSKQHTHITYQTLTKARAHLIYWTKRICHALKQIEIPNMGRLFNRCMEAMQFAARKRRITARAKQKGQFSSITLPEIQRLIDSVLVSTPCRRSPPCLVLGKSMCFASRINGVVKTFSKRRKPHR